MHLADAFTQSFSRALHSSPENSYLSFGVLTNLTWHIVSTLDKRLCDVVVVNRDNAKRDEEVDEEYHNGVNLGMHLIGEWIRHTSGERYVLIWHMNHLREDRLGDSQQHWDNPYSDGLQACPEHCAGGLDVHGIHNSFVSKKNIWRIVSTQIAVPFIHVWGWMKEKIALFINNLSLLEGKQHCGFLSEVRFDYL